MGRAMQTLTLSSVQTRKTINLKFVVHYLYSLNTYSEKKRMKWAQFYEKPFLRNAHHSRMYILKTKFSCKANIYR